MVLSTASGYHFDNMLYVKLHQSSITEGSGSSYLFKDTGASAAVDSVDTASVLQCANTPLSTMICLWLVDGTQNHIRWVL